ncbi:very long chain fatty acid elongase 6-like [Oscarella lobularis]|uniref:very long chain fatty acid elongase 6-like n=1 Tax=Oscarella lobularis TaxID=121494 RepID=UPI003313A394
MELLSAIESFESRFNETNAQLYLRARWKRCFYASAIYVVAILVGRHYMKSRPGFDLRRTLFAWNLLLALFSAVGTYHVTVPFVTDVLTSGWSSAVCTLKFLEGREGLWSFIFGFSKLPELIDTLFIVLRKQRLIFLHWYHHMTVFCYCWWAYTSPHGQGRLFIAMNYCVHMVMYSYYATRAQGIVRLPRQVNVLITMMQIAQMCIGSWSLFDAAMRLRDGIPCAVEQKHVFWGSLMYTSYLVLFGNFFYQTYMKKKKSSPAEIKLADGKKKSAMFEIR